MARVRDADAGLRRRGDGPRPGRPAPRGPPPPRRRERGPAPSTTTCASATSSTCAPTPGPARRGPGALGRDRGTTATAEFDWLGHGPLRHPPDLPGPHERHVRALGIDPDAGAADVPDARQHRPGVGARSRSPARSGRSAPATGCCSWASAPGSTPRASRSPGDRAGPDDPATARAGPFLPYAEPLPRTARTSRRTPSAAPAACRRAACPARPAWSRLVTAPDARRRAHLARARQRAGRTATSTLGTLLCVHGNPTWSYLWRRLLAARPPGWRVVAPDQLGHGLLRAAARAADAGRSASTTSAT